MHVLLDELRRNLCIDTEFLTEEKFDAIRRASQEWLKDPWALSDDAGTYSGTAYPGGRPKGAAGDRRRTCTCPGWAPTGAGCAAPTASPLHDHPLKTADATGVIESLLDVMADAGILVRIPGTQAAARATACVPT